MMRRKKLLNLCLAAALTLVFAAGCSGTGDSADGREKVTVALWSDQLTEHYAGYLQSRFPEVEFEFYVATNSTDFYRFKHQNGDLPDILTVRRFSLNDVEPWRSSLMDLSDSELANSFYQPYIRNYTYSDGSVNWLPASGEVDGIIINKTLFEENNIKIPTDYSEFTDACRQLKALGIRPFISNFGMDYTCMEILQGLSVSALTSNEGREWRQKYESGQTDQLSEEVWLPVFQRMLDFIEYAEVVPSDMEESIASVYDAFKEEKAAMVRGTADEAATRGIEQDALILPYFGERSEDDWYLTYPSFQAAANISAERSPQRKQLILDIMTAMLEEEGLLKLTDGRDMIAYNKGVEPNFSPMLESIDPYIAKNQLYIRLASSQMFSASKEVVQKMITGEYSDARTALDAFNAAMETGADREPVAAHIDKGYSYAFDPESGSAAASAVMNTLREELGTQLAVGQSVNVAGNIAAGDYTRRQLDFLTLGEATNILMCDMTGEQLWDYLEYVLTVPEKRGTVTNDSTLYVSSGFEMEISKGNGDYRLERLTAGGKEIEKTAVYSVAVLGSEPFMQKEALAAAGVKEYEDMGNAFKQIVADRLAGGRQLAEPTDYITLKS